MSSQHSICQSLGARVQTLGKTCPRSDTPGDQPGQVWFRDKSPLGHVPAKLTLLSQIKGMVANPGWLVPERPEMSQPSSGPTKHNVVRGTREPQPLNITVHPTPCTLNPIDPQPSTLNPIDPQPCTLHPTPDTLNCAPYTLTQGGVARGRATTTRTSTGGTLPPSRSGLSN